MMKQACTATHISRAIELSDTKAKYDAEVKSMLSDKIILAWILKYTVRELQDYDIDTIKDCIEGEPEISKVPVYPGRSGSSKIIGSNTEDKVVNEGEIRYDIRFFVILPYALPDGRRRKLLINVEAQKEYYTGYTLVTRGVFYGARMLSSQIDTEFTVPDYDSIKKVYSIWICMDTPEYAANTITDYRLVPDKLAGDYAEETKYDLLSVVMVCMGKDVIYEKSPTLLGLLSVILSHQLTVEEKKKRLELIYGIPMTEKLEKEMNLMCNLSDLIEKTGIAKGAATAEQSAAIQMLKDGLKPEKIVTYLSTLTLTDVENIAEQL